MPRQSGDDKTRLGHLAAQPGTCNHVNLSHKPSKLLITGCSGSGKTTFAMRYLLGKVAGPKFIFDHEGEFALRLKTPSCRSPQEMFDALPSGWVLFDPCRMFPGDLEAGFRFFLEWAFNVSTKLGGNKLFACDELQKLVGTAKCPWELALVLETGRRHGLDTLMITQQPNLIHNRVRNQTTEVVTFRQVDKAAVGYLEDLGFDAERIRKLCPGSYLLRNLQNGAERQGSVFRVSAEGQDSGRPIKTPVIES
ncbi:MAG: hypothetical protein MUE94_03660 [Verrucomicrobia bacterium]|nr:hypothetical protein [Verrucomicrobiota bacterium]